MADLSSSSSSNKIIKDLDAEMVTGISNQRHTSDFRTDNEWIKETKDLIKTTDNDQYMSKNLREATKRLEDKVKKKTITNASKVDKALRKKLETTNRLKELLESAINNADLEKQQLGITRQALENKEKKIKSKLNLSYDRIKLRDQRPSRELVNDSVHLNLRKQELMLQSYLKNIQNGIKATDSNILKINHCKNQLQDDLQNKIKALDLDKEVLEGKMTTGDNNNNKKKGDLILNGSINLHPHKWTMKTDDNIKDTTKILGYSEKMRNEIKEMVKHEESQRKEDMNYLNKMMLDKLNDTTKLKDNLNNKLEETRKEIELCRQRKKALEKALEEKNEPLEKAMNRLMNRKERPYTERVDDEVHYALLNEIKQLKSIILQLKQKIKSVENEISSLKQKEKLMENNIEDKEKSWKMDERCIMMDGRMNFSRPPTSIGSQSLCSARSLNTNFSRSLSSNITLKSDIMDRIDKLENELIQAKSDRLSFESDMNQLKEKLK